jgi:hypothetical protein
MTLTALLVLVTGLAASDAGRASSAPSTLPKREATPAGRVVTAPAGADQRPGPLVTCTLRVIHVSPEPDAAILVRLPVQAKDDIVRDSVSPCQRP